MNRTLQPEPRTASICVAGPPGRLLHYDGEPITARPSLDSLIGLLEAAGLTGRGGAGFPTARKLVSVASQRRRPAVVVNAMEGEPLAHKDEALLGLAPGLVLDGAEILASALKAQRIAIGVGAQIPTHRLRLAAGARRTTMRIESFPDTFVGGQESALVSALNGRAGIPKDPATPIWQRGLEGRPTLVVNTETAAQVALAVRHGAAWFRQAGTTTDPGTFLLSISGSSDEVIGTGVTEAARGTVLGDVLDRFEVRPGLVGGVLVGGYHGAWLPPSALATTLDRESLAPWGAATGAGVVHVLDRRQCPLEVTAGIVAYLADQGARQCGPCLNGLPRLAQTLTTLATAGVHDQRLHPDVIDHVHHLSGLVERRGACAHPDGTVRLIRSTLRTFAEHVDAHLSGACPR